MRRRSTPQTAQPAAMPRSKPMEVDTKCKTFRVNAGDGKTEVVEAAKMEVQDNGLTFKDAKGDVVAVFRGYGLSAVCDEHATAQHGDPCETVRSRDFF